MRKLTEAEKVRVQGYISEGLNAVQVYGLVGTEFGLTQEQIRRRMLSIKKEMENARRAPREQPKTFQQEMKAIRDLLKTMGDTTGDGLAGIDRRLSIIEAKQVEIMSFMGDLALDMLDVSEALDIKIPMQRVTDRRTRTMSAGLPIPVEAPQPRRKQVSR